MLTKEEIKNLSEPSLWKWSIRMIFDWFLVALVLFQARYFNTAWSYLLAIFLLGPLQHAIGILGHDGTHRRISRNSKLNDFLTAWVSLAPMTMPLGLYREFHFGHHRNLGTEKDGEITFKEEFAPIWDLPIKKSQIYKTVILDYLGINFYNVVKMGKGPAAATFSDKIPSIVFWIVAIVLMWITGTWWILPLWFCATGSSFWAAFRFRLWCEHMGTTGTYRYEAKLWQKLLFLQHNIDIHWEHHKYPSIPLWNLPKARKMIKEVPIIPLSEVFESLERMQPIPSGTVLTAGMENDDGEFFPLDGAT